MIRINVLSTKKKRRINKAIYELLLFMMVVAFVVASCFLVNSSLNTQILIVKGEIAKLDREFKRLTKIKQEVDGFKKKKEDLQRKIDIVKKLKSGQKGYYKILTTLEYSMPQDLWISKFDYNNGSVNITGSSLRSSSVNEFITNLYSTKMFSNIDLKVVKKVSIENIDINEFNITANITLGD